MTAADRVPLDKYESMTENELYEELGRHLLGSGPGMTPDDRREARDFGRTWFRNQYDRLRHSVCLHPRLQGFRDNSVSDNVIDAGAIYVAAEQVLSDTVQAAIVAVLATRIGLSAFCAGVAPDGSPDA
ncbi:hypothetical protein [Streptomyces luteogriseus]|uniref:hypothetical protein n=1 Tax=Streptomyces luteogriseus TaxID=68233 RepID=UPI002E2EF321|nr:hypothetical protein [Streptomyces luteogriseus]WTJ30251.1 hypothetical protein OID52_25985 [Streptomyces luteogriseus]